MSHSHSLFTLFLLLLEFLTAGALYGHGVARCLFSSPDGRDAVYLEQYYFNKVLMLQYNSTVGKVVGYNQHLRVIADKLNKDEDFMDLMIWKTKRCTKSVPLVVNGLLNPVMPYVSVKSVKAASSGHPGVLSCSVYNFYPKQIKVTWLRDGREVKSDVTSTDELPSGNWLYQIHSELEYEPRPGEKLTCMVEHASFKQPKVYDWEPGTDAGMGKIALGTAGLLLGLVFFVFALVYYKQQSTVGVLVPTSEVLYPDHTL